MRDPAVLFYSQDFITGTLLMSDEQRGKYIMLLCLQHQHDKLTEKDMLKICGGYDADIWAKFRKDEQGFFYNERLLLETERRSKYNQSRRKNLKTDAHMDAHMETCNKKYEIEDREFEFKKEIAAFENYPVEMLTAFFNYWSEPNKSKTKMRFELQKTFDIKRRLGTWASRDNDITAKPSAFGPKYRSYDEMCKDAGTNPDIWKQYKALKMPDLPRPVWLSVNDISKFNLKQYEVK
jgi:uncharacterized protein YdaU (DUF1376 family)